MQEGDAGPSGELLMRLGSCIEDDRPWLQRVSGDIHNSRCSLWRVYVRARVKRRWRIGRFGIASSALKGEFALGEFALGEFALGEFALTVERIPEHDLGDVCACVQYPCVELPRVISRICIAFSPNPSNDDCSTQSDGHLLSCVGTAIPNS